MNYFIVNYRKLHFILGILLHLLNLYLIIGRVYYRESVMNNKIIKFECKRRYDRFKSSEGINVWLSSRKKSWSAREEGVLRDISESGFGVTMKETPNIGNEVFIDFFFSDTRITTVGTIIYSRKVREGFAVGIKLKDNAKPIMAFIKSTSLELNKVN